MLQMLAFDTCDKRDPHLKRTQLGPLKLNESWAGRRLLEALSQLPPPTNQSPSLNMRFQRKQLLEREQKKVALTGGEAVNETSLPAKGIGNGKVRQMFDERRRGAGIDRSNPLKPITTTTTTTTATTTTIVKSSSLATGSQSVQRRPAGAAAAGATARRPTNVARTAAARGESGDKTSTASNGNLFRNSPSDINFDEMDNIDNETFPAEFSSLSLNENRVSGLGDRNNNNSNNRNNNNNNSNLDKALETNANQSADQQRTTSSSNGIKLNPVITKKSPSVSATRTTPRQTAASTSGTAQKATPTKVTSSKPPTSAVKPSKTSVGKVIVKKMATKPPPRLTTPPPGMASCHFCGRNFNEDRLSKHEQVCQKMANTKRKIFDASKHRVKGTEAEKFLRKQTSRSTTNTAARYTSAAAASGLQVQPNQSVKKSNWRKKHEEFIAAIREAKKVQAHLARGGKLSDLPPPPPSENPDYIQCPHCSRRFNEAAAERHIPKCANMLHNKPKPGQAASRRR